MATDVFQFLVDILKINQNLVNEYASQGPLYQMFYLFVFPAIFIIIFIWILTNRIMGEHKGLRILLSVGVYAFIILQGYYSWFATLSKFWFFGLLALGFLYFISYRGGGGRGKGAQGMTGGVSTMERLSSRLNMKITGQEKQMHDRIEADLKKLEGMKGGGHEYGDIYIHVEKELKDLEVLVRGTDVTGMGFKVGSRKYNELWERFLKLPNPSPTK